MLMAQNETVNIFYSCDGQFLKYTAVSIFSLMKNSAKDRRYHIHVLHTDIEPVLQKRLLDMQNDTFKITFDNVCEYLDEVCERLPLRDYYSSTTYYRLFIAEMYPDVDKAIYIDSDTVVEGDVSELYGTDISDYMVAACREQAMVQEDVYGTYVERCLGIDRNSYFNAGVLLINCKKFRELHVLDSFVSLLGIYNFRVTQDEDYLNVICKDHVLFMPQCWNAEVFGVMDLKPGACKIIHYIMVSKPWHYADCRLGEIFWHYAAKTPWYAEIKAVLEEYTDSEKERDAASLKRLAALAREESERPDTYLARIAKTRDPKRLAVLEKIDALEREGTFDIDVEDDPPTRPLREGEVDFFCRKPKSRVARRLAYFFARRFVNKQIKNGELIITDVKGVENLASLKSGAVLTCNHFNAFDSFAMQIAYERAGFNNKKPRLFRVVREGNYTSFPGFYGFLMRHCNTLPLSSSHSVMREFMSATEQLLRDGNFVLIYPEQSMWWNYRKPKPLKQGAFRFAAKCSVPVVPFFVTMRDSAKIGADGFPIQEYTIHISEPIYPPEGISTREASEFMLRENERIWREIYEREYAVPLKYLSEAEIRVECEV